MNKLSDRLKEAIFDYSKRIGPANDQIDYLEDTVYLDKVTELVAAVEELERDVAGYKRQSDEQCKFKEIAENDRDLWKKACELAAYRIWEIAKAEEWVYGKDIQPIHWYQQAKHLLVKQ